MGMDEQLASEMTGAVRMLSGAAVSGLQSETDENDRDRIARQQALLEEQQARHDASEAVREGEKEAREVRERGERGLGAMRARKARSGVAMSGSRALVDAARTAEAREEEQEVRDEARLQADDILRSGRRKADSRRLAAGLEPRKTALSLGAKLYGNRR